MDNHIYSFECKQLDRNVNMKLSIGGGYIYYEQRASEFEYGMHQVQPDTYILEMRERHYLIIYLHVIIGGKFIIRIEDTDQKRNIEGGEESQLKYLKWLGMDWDESVDVGGEYGPYRQSERIDIYQKLYQDLLESGHSL